MDGFRHFTSNNFDFKTVNFQKLEKELNEKDKKTFFCDMLKVWNSHHSFVNFMKIINNFF